jgi:hypothetical protein
MGSADPSSFIPMIELPPELFTQWLAAAINALAKMEHAQPGTVAAIVAQKAAQWAADQKLEACCQLLDINGCPGEWIDMLRAAHRPKPLSLKQEALNIFKYKEVYRDMVLNLKDVDTIIRALEALPDD